MSCHRFPFVRTGCIALDGSRFGQLPGRMPGMPDRIVRAPAFLAEHLRVLPRYLSRTALPVRNRSQSLSGDFRRVPDSIRIFDRALPLATPIRMTFQVRFGDRKANFTSMTAQFARRVLSSKELFDPPLSLPRLDAMPPVPIMRARHGRLDKATMDFPATRPAA